ncbi:Chaperone protein DnaJ [hydrothermal vent metagenome]|uniref:Chaperone protein DnaJ n=1 Tax=hydrothermal vent metagenome TaxID=652676 RepID=A0A3B1CYS5_9ZZZZ
MAQDYYKTLGVTKSSTEAEIKKAYRKLAKKYHPDRNQDNKKAEEKFKEVSEAYAVLSDKTKRAKYDQIGHDTFHQNYSQEDIFKGANFEDVFKEFGIGGDILSQIFGGGMRGGRSRARYQSYGGPGMGGAPGPMKGQDYETSVTIPFMDAMKGGERELRLSVDGGVKALTVKIPPGIATGKKLRLRGKGGSGAMGGPAGDIYINIKVAEDRVFKRDGSDITVEIPVPYSTLILGGSAKAPTLNGERTIKIAPGFDPSKKIRIKGAGAPKLKGGVNGDLYVKLHVSAPKSPTKEQKDLAKKLAKTGL